MKNFQLILHFYHLHIKKLDGPPWGLDVPCGTITLMPSPTYEIHPLRPISSTVFSSIYLLVVFSRLLHVLHPVTVSNAADT